MKNIFLVGPASVGKSTTGRLLAAELGLTFVDIDLYFCDEIELIPNYINTKGYVSYCERNSKLVDELIQRFPKNAVFATPAGFLAHEESPELVEKHSKLIDSNAVSILLLPSDDPRDTVELIVQRQITRWPELDYDNEKSRYIRRHALYRDKGSIQIIGLYDTKTIVDKILKALDPKIPSQA